MNCFGHIYKLRRTHIGNFSTKCAILLDLSEKLIHSSAILKNILPIEKVLESLPFINLTKKQEIAIRNGKKICLDELNIEASVISREFELSYPEYRYIRFYMVPFTDPRDPNNDRQYAVILSDITEEKISTEEMIAVSYTHLTLPTI